MVLSTCPSGEKPSERSELIVLDAVVGPASALLSFDESGVEQHSEVMVDLWVAGRTGSLRFAAVLRTPQAPTRRRDRDPGRRG